MRLVITVLALRCRSDHTLNQHEIEGPRADIAKLFDHLVMVRALLQWGVLSSCSANEIIGAVDFARPAATTALINASSRGREGCSCITLHRSRTRRYGLCRDGLKKIAFRDP